MFNRCAPHGAKEDRKMALPASNLFNRDDTLFGICEALGQDLGFNPLWLRLAFLPFLFVAPAYTIGAYFLLGLGVWASRTLFPAAPASSSDQAVATAFAAPAAVIAEESVRQDVPLAA